MRTLLTLLLLLLIAAAPVDLDLPRGSLGQAVAALGRQADVSIGVADAALWQRQVPALKGRMSVAAALRRIARGEDIEIAALDARTWRITVRPRRVATPPKAAAAPLPPLLDDEPIIVTASKRDVPIGAYQGAVSVLDGRDLAFGGERGTEAILSRLATVASTHLGAGRNKLFIRGIADSSFTGPTQATVGQYLGDIRLTYNAPDPDLRLYDIASVEVLEGPQGTLYGAGSLGGIIRIVRNAPRLGVTLASVSAGVSATAHGDAGGDAGGMINLPLGDRIALRLVGYAVSEGGYIDGVLRGKDDINRTRIAGGRATLRLDAGDDWTIDIGGTVQAIDGDDSQYADRDARPLSHASRFAQGFEARYGLADLVVAKRWDDLRLLSSTGIARQRLFERFDASAPGGPDRLFTQSNHTLLISNETRLWRPMRGGYGWVIGGSILANRTRLTRALGPLSAPEPVTGVTNRIREATLYGEASFEMLPGLTVTGGGRLTRARLSGAGEDIAPAIALARAALTADRTHTRLLPSLAISATPLPRLILFVRTQQGFRPGGLSIDGDFVRRFRNDQVTSIETGFRYGEPEHDAFDLSATVAATRWTDIQADFVDTNGLPATANIGDGRIYSLALKGGWRPLDGLSLDVAMTINDGRITDPNAEFMRVFALSQMTGIPNVARYAARAGVDYRADLRSGLDLHVAASGQYVGRSRLGIGPVLGAEQGDYGDVALTARVGRPGLGLTLGVTNLADSVGNRFALGTPFGGMPDGQITPLRPRTLRLGIDARF